MNLFAKFFGLTLFLINFLQYAFVVFDVFVYDVYKLIPVLFMMFVVHMYLLVSVVDGVVKNVRADFGPVCCENEFCTMKTCLLCIDLMLLLAYMIIYVVSVWFSTLPIIIQLFSCWLNALFVVYMCMLFKCVHSMKETDKESNVDLKIAEKKCQYVSTV